MLSSILKLSWLKIFIFIPAMFVAASIISLIVQALQADQLSTFFHIFFSSYSLNSLWLAFWVGLCSLMVGTICAAMISFYRFPGSKILEWVLVMPLAFPGYVMGYCLISMWDFSGPIQSLYRSIFSEYQFPLPEIRSFWGLVFTLTLCLYPYVYLLARNAFQTMGKSIFDAARVLGLKPIPSFFQVTLPNSWPWLVIGFSVVGMECLADFGTVSLFNFDSLTTAIYKSWLGHYSLSEASLISLSLFLWIGILYFLFRKIKSQNKIDQSWVQDRQVGRIRLQGFNKWFLTFLMWFFVGISFLMPLAQIIYWCIQAIDQRLWQNLGDVFYHSLVTGLLACTILGLIAFMAVASHRFYQSKILSQLSKLSQIGYALPGSILAIAVFIPLIKLDHIVGDFSQNIFGVSLPLVFTGSIFALMVGYMVRFFTLPYNSIKSANKRLPQNIDKAALSLGCSGVSLIRRIHFPGLKTGLITAMILVFVDVLKEMPLTLMTRPFGWDTLAVRIFEMTSEGDWIQASIPSLVLVILGMIPVRFLVKKSSKL